MNPLIKKEVRLVLPAWIVAMLLALVQAATRTDDFYIAFLVFFGFTLMALSAIGRETSLNTFSSMLAQPEERERIWKVKLAVLFTAFLTVFLVWFAAFVFSVFHMVFSHDTDRQTLYLLVTVCLSVTTTFTGGLWSTLLLRQVAGALWLTLLVPAVLCGIVAAFLSTTDSDNAVIAGLSTIIAVYSVGGFFFARWLFFRAQDVGWSGGVIVLPEWGVFGAGARTANQRHWKPFIATVKKELQLQPATLVGAAVLLVAHIAVIIWRHVHQFPKNSDWDMVTQCFWMLWLILPVVIGASAIAEERKLGVAESQMCLPVSRRFQFIIKFVMAMFLGLFLGGFMPVFLEAWGIFGVNSAFGDEGRTGGNTLIQLQIVICSLAFWLTLASFLASSLTRNFLQALGCGLGIMVACPLIFAALLGTFDLNHMPSFMSVPNYSPLPFIIVIPVMIITFIALAWSNFKSLYQGWPLWRRNLVIFAIIILVTDLTIPAIYHRAWEVFKPAEPAHGTSVLTQAQAPTIKMGWGSVQVRLPDGRVWMDALVFPFEEQRGPLSTLLNMLKIGSEWQLPRTAGDPHAVAGSNWVSVVSDHIEFEHSSVSGPPDKSQFISGYLDTIGVKTDGTLWAADNVDDRGWNGDQMVQFGNETDWAQIARMNWSIILLKKNGTLWHWGDKGENYVDFRKPWVDFRNKPFTQIGTASDWKELEPKDLLLRKNDGTTSQIQYDNAKTNDLRLVIKPRSELDHLPLKNTALSDSSESGAYIDEGGDLWFIRGIPPAGYTNAPAEKLQIGTGAKWKAVVFSWRQMIGLRADGTLWRWPLPDFWRNETMDQWRPFLDSPERLGIHNDWVAITQCNENIVTLAADGSLWFWPNPEQNQPLMKFPKQPIYFGNVLK